MSRRRSLRINWRTAALSAAVTLACAAAGAARAAGPEEHTVTIEDLRFAPATLTVKAGDSIVWLNKDVFAHTATSASGRFDSRLIDAGGSWKLVTKRKGRFSYRCEFHPTMTAELHVE